MRILRCSLAQLFMAVMFSFLPSLTNAQSLPEQPIHIGFTAIDLGGYGRIAWAPAQHVLAVSVESDLYLYTVDLIQIMQFHGHTERITSIDWSPEGKRVATSSYDNTVRIWDMDPASQTYGEALSVLDHTEDVYGVAWMPVIGTNMLATKEFVDSRVTSETARIRSHIHIWDVSAQSIINTFPPIYSMGGNIAWTSDGDYLAHSGLELGQPYIVRIWDTNSWQLVDEQAVTRSWINSLSWQPTSDRLGIVEDINYVIIYQLNQDSNLTYIDQFQANTFERAYTVDWKNNGDLIAWAGQDRYLRIWDIAAERVYRVLTPHSNTIGQISWSWDDVYLASQSHEGELRIWAMTDVACDYSAGLENAGFCGVPAQLQGYEE